MKCRVYRNLDRPFTLMGVQGRYIPVALCGAVAVVLFAVMMGSAWGAFVGLGTALCIGVAGYLGLLEVQGRWGEKGLSRFLSGRRLPKFILIRSKVWRV